MLRTFSFVMLFPLTRTENSNVCVIDDFAYESIGVTCASVTVACCFCEY